jgi:hypothetical protein
MTDRNTQKFLEMIEKEGIKIDPDIDYKKLAGSTYEFLQGNKIYHLEYTVSLDEKGKRIFEFKFKLMNNPKGPKRSDYKTGRQYKIAVQKSQVGITGTGDAKQVFDKVISVLIKILQSESPEYVTFQAQEENRQRLYLLLLKNAIQQIKNYKSLDKNPLTNNNVEDGEFWLEKI